jgi:hypothetical protein
MFRDADQQQRDLIRQIELNNEARRAVASGNPDRIRQVRDKALSEGFEAENLSRQLPDEKDHWQAVDAAREMAANREREEIAAFGEEVRAYEAEHGAGSYGWADDDPGNG